MSPRILSDARLNNRRKSCRLCVVSSDIHFSGNAKKVGVKIPLLWK